MLPALEARCASRCGLRYMLTAIVSSRDQETRKGRTSTVVVLGFLSASSIATTGVLSGLFLDRPQDAVGKDRYESLLMGALVLATCVFFILVSRLLLLGTNLFLTCTCGLAIVLHLFCLMIVLTNFLRTNASSTVTGFWVALAVGACFDCLLLPGIIYYDKTALPRSRGSEANELTRLRRRQRKYSDMTGSCEIFVNFDRLNADYFAKPPTYASVMPPERVDNVDNWQAPCVHPGHARLTMSPEHQGLFEVNSSGACNGRLPSYQAATDPSRRAVSDAT